ncbi:unnamed protein product [Onchocerca flexuosa]|uniref:NTP_transferase domain-containing protein n=1 Tax=Onchocerca flexuosa TaxID=387005 RepID=A0A183HXS1_9BILA|nr:unnamed protein product [Onchocerca flexuosa]
MFRSDWGDAQLASSMMMTLKAVILVGGAQKGTRFRPLSLQLPKPLFPIAGVPLIEHHIEQLSKVNFNFITSHLIITAVLNVL